MAPHPEGGHFAEVFRSQDRVQTGRGERRALTTIDFLLREHEFSAWHRVRSDEVWHLLEGATVGPGFDFADFAFGRDDAALRTALPEPLRRLL